MSKYTITRKFNLYRHYHLDIEAESQEAAEKLAEDMLLWTAGNPMDSEDLDWRRGDTWEEVEDSVAPAKEEKAA